jgi:DNA-binding transcriptional regulator GbsR (MarR family)
MDRATGIFVDGVGTAAATSGILSQLQGRIFALLYLRQQPLALEEIAAELQQSKSNISVNIRGLVEWHLVRRTPIGGSRKDHYEAATNFWRVMQEVMERRFRWTVRQVLATLGETERAASETPARARDTDVGFVATRLGALRIFFTAVDAAIGAFTQGKPVDAETLQKVVTFAPPQARRR